MDTIDINILREYWYRNKDKHESIVNNLTYYQHGIWFTEAFLFCSINNLLNIELLVESGTAYGQSTEIFANYLEQDIITIDNDYLYNQFEITKNRLSKYDNIKCLKGDSLDIIPILLEQNKEKRIALFIDGLEESIATNLSNSLSPYNNIISIGYHDIPPQALNVRDGSQILFSQSIHFINEEYSYLNKKITEMDSTQKKYLPNGPGLCVTIL